MTHLVICLQMISYIVHENHNQSLCVTHYKMFVCLIVT